MSVQGYTWNVTDTPLLLATIPIDGAKQHKLIVTNLTQTDDIYLGNPDITFGSGFLVTKQNATGISYRAEFNYAGGEKVYAIAPSGKTVPVRVSIISYQ